MSRRNKGVDQKEPSPREEAVGAHAGLVLHGVVVGRSRTMFPEQPKDGEVQRERITYRVKCGDRTEDVVAYAPQTYYAVGELVAIPVRVNARAYNGRAFVNLVIPDDRPRGEEF